jgi:hypothetical protein
MNIEMQGAEAYNLFCKGFHDGENPYRQGTNYFEEWEQGWENSMRLDQWIHEQQLQWEQKEIFEKNFQNNLEK